MNFEDSLGNASIRLQWVDCQEAPQDAGDPEMDIDKLKNQLWSGELDSGSAEMIVLRNPCSDKVVKKVESDASHSHDKLY